MLKQCLLVAPKSPSLNFCGMRSQGTRWVCPNSRRWREGQDCLVKISASHMRSYSKHRRKLFAKPVVEAVLVMVVGGYGDWHQGMKRAASNTEDPSRERRQHLAFQFQSC